MLRPPYPTLFLDVDDVIVLDRTAEFDKHRVGELAQAVCQRLIHPPAGQALIELLSESTTKVVITSNWVRFTTQAALERLFRLAGYELLATSLHRSWSAPREGTETRLESIEQWLAKHYRGESYAIIDDEDSGASLRGSRHDAAGRVLLCQPGVGLHRGHLPKIRTALNQEI